MSNDMMNARESIWAEVRERLDRLALTLDGARHLSEERTARILDARAAAIGAPPPVVSGAVPRIELLTLMLSRERFAVETRFVREVVPLTGVTPVPGTPDHILGIASLRGEILAIVDLRRLFGLVVENLDKPARLVVLGIDEMEMAILAEEVQEVVSLPLDEVADRPATPCRIEPIHLLGVTADALITLDGAALLKDPRLFVDHRDAGSSSEEKPWHSI
jgi:purine-binding chemotaxis protein CheW